VVTAALSRFSATLRHKYTLGVALTSLVLAMIALLYRNYLAPQVEFHEARLTAYVDTELKERKAKRFVLTRIYYAEVVGIALSALGVFLLLVQVWLVLTS
jgi:hypothetical protein